MNRDQVWGAMRQDLPSQELPVSYQGQNGGPAFVRAGNYPLPGGGAFNPPAAPGPSKQYAPPLEPSAAAAALRNPPPPFG
eukprot:8992736-Pyramimonas_sp.AAC.1